MNEHDSPAVRAAIEQEQRFGGIESELRSLNERFGHFQETTGASLAEVLAETKRINGTVAEVVRWREGHTQTHIALNEKVDAAAAQSYENSGHIEALQQARHEEQLVDGARKSVWRSQATWLQEGMAFARLVIGLLTTLGLWQVLTGGGF